MGRRGSRLTCWGVIVLVAVGWLFCPLPAAAQDAADAEKYDAKIFTVDVPDYAPEKVTDFVNAFMMVIYSNPAARWRPLDVRSRGEASLRLTALSRGGMWLPTGNAIEYNFFAEPTASGTRLSHYFTAIQNTGSGFEHRTDITHAANMTRVWKGLYADAEKYLPQIGQLMAQIKSTGALRLTNPTQAVYISPAREKFVEDAEQAYLAGDAARTVAILQEAALSDRPAALRRLSYLYSRGEGVPADLQASNDFLLRAARQGDPVSVANRDYFGIGTDANARLGYAMLWFLARSGNLEAMISMALILERQPDPQRYARDIYRLYAIAGSLGHAVAKARADQLATTTDADVASVAADIEIWKKFATELKWGGG